MVPRHASEKRRRERHPKGSDPKGPDGERLYLTQEIAWEWRVPYRDVQAWHQRGWLVETTIDKKGRPWFTTEAAVAAIKLAALAKYEIKP